MGAKVKVPERAKRGDIVEVRALAIHVMETGFRHDNVGKLIPRHIVESFDCRYAGEEIFFARLHPGIAMNPYFVFYFIATQSGELVFTWKDDRGEVITERAPIEVEAG